MKENIARPAANQSRARFYCSQIIFNNNGIRLSYHLKNYRDRSFKGNRTSIKMAFTVAMPEDEIAEFLTKTELNEFKEMQN